MLDGTLLAVPFFLRRKSTCHQRHVHVDSLHALAHKALCSAQFSACTRRLHCQHGNRFARKHIIFQTPFHHGFIARGPGQRPCCTSMMKRYLCVIHEINCDLDLAIEEHRLAAIITLDGMIILVNPWVWEAKRRGRNLHLSLHCHSKMTHDMMFFSAASSTTELYRHNTSQINNYKCVDYSNLTSKKKNVHEHMPYPPWAQKNCA